jgi:hypothetical protein
MRRNQQELRPIWVTNKRDELVNVTGRLDARHPYTPSGVDEEDGWGITTSQYPAHLDEDESGAMNVRVL